MTGTEPNNDRELLTESRRLLRVWQRFAVELGAVLGRGGTTDDLLEAAKELKNENERLCEKGRAMAEPKEPNDREKVIFARVPEQYAATFRQLYQDVKNTNAGEASITVRWVLDNDDLEIDDFVPEIRFRVKQVGPVEEKE